MKKHISLALLSLLYVQFFHRVASQAVTYQGLNPSEVVAQTRESWCKSQQTTCSQVCAASGSSTDSTGNSCNSATLTWTCQCLSGASPSVTQYSDSLSCLATGYQLTNCLNNATTSTETNTCHINFYCQGLDSNNLPNSGGQSISSTGTATSVPYYGASSTLATYLQSSTPPQSTSTSTSNTPHNTSFAWIAAPILIILFLLSGLLFALWLIKRKRRRTSSRPQIRIIKNNTGMNSSMEVLWRKAELDGVSEKDRAQNQIYELPTREDEHVELEGSPAMPVELEGSTPGPRLSSFVKPKLRPLSVLPPPPRLSLFPGSSSRGSRQMSPVSPDVNQPSNAPASPGPPPSPMTPSSGW